VHPQRNRAHVARINVGCGAMRKRTSTRQGSIPNQSNRPIALVEQRTFESRQSNDLENPREI
jgi:hypothetical protein